MRTELLEGEGPRQLAWRLSFSHPDTVDRQAEWTASVSAIFDDRTEVLVCRLERARSDGTIRPARTSRLHRDVSAGLMDSPILEVVDGDRRLSSSVWVVREAEAPLLASLLMSRSRRLPFVGFTHDGMMTSSTVANQTQLMGVAHVALIFPAACWKLDELLPTGFNVYGGAVRLWWPGIADRSSKWDDPLWFADNSARQITEQIVDRVVDASFQARHRLWSDSRNLKASNESEILYCCVPRLFAFSPNTSGRYPM